MICKRCGSETSNVICVNCGVNVVWFNKYGYNRTIYDLVDCTEEEFEKENKSVEDTLKEVFIPDGSGD